MSLEFMSLFLRPARMLFILTFGLLVDRCLARDFWVSKWSETPVGPDGPWHALNISWDDNPFQTFAMLPSLTKTSLLVAADACSTQDSKCPNQVNSGVWPMWTSSAAHKPYLRMDGPLFRADTWDDTVSHPLNLSGDAQWVHERGIIWNTDNVSVNLFDQATTLTYNMTVNFPGREGYTLNVGYFSLFGSGSNISWLNTTGFQVTQNLQLPMVKNMSSISSISYGLQIGSPSLEIEPSLVLGGYDRSRCLTEPITTKSETFQLMDISVGAAESGWPFTSTNDTKDSDSKTQTGLLGDTAPLQVLANPGVPYLYLPDQTCNAIAGMLPVIYSKDFGLYIWDTSSPYYKEIVTTLSYLSFTLMNVPETGAQQEQQIHVPFALLDLELDYPLSTNKTRYFPCTPYTPRKGQPYHLGRAFLQAALLAQNWETNTTWLSQAPGPNMTGPSTPVVIEETHTTISTMPSPPDWLSTWNGTLSLSTFVSNGTTMPASSPSSLTSLSSGAIAGIAIGAVAGLAILTAAIFFFIRHHRAKAGYGDVALISFADSDNSQPPSQELDSKGTTEAASTPIYEVASPEKKPQMGELSSDSKTRPVEVDGVGIAELPGHDVHPR